MENQWLRIARSLKLQYYKWIPHPLLTLVLILLWLALQNSFSPGNIVVAIVLGMTISLFTSNFWPDRPRIARPLLAIRFVFILLLDVIIANVQVAYLILFKRSTSLRPGWVTMPLELRTPEAITWLMATITLTPGTVSSDISDDGRYLLIHCLDVEDASRLIENLKVRYEKQLLEIFP